MQKRFSISLISIVGAMLVAALVWSGDVIFASHAVEPFAPAATPTPQSVYLPVVSANIRGAHLAEMGAPDDLAVVGEPYSSTVKVLLYDDAYQVTGFSLLEQDSFGVTSPQIDAAGVVTWQPTAADVGVHRFLLTAHFSDQSQLVQPVSIEVAQRTWLIRASVGDAGGTVTAAGGDYRVEIPENAMAEGEAAVDVAVSVVKRADGSVRVSRAFDGLRSDVLPTYEEPLYAVVQAAAPEPDTAGACTDLPFITALNPDPLQWKGGYVYEVDDDYANLRPEQNVSTVRLRNHVNLSYYPAADGRGMSELRGACKTQCLGKQPVLFVHGYTPFGALGGGVDTWNCAFDYVEKLGGAPFEFRWRGNTRFEDAAYQLARAIAHVTELTGRKPLVIGHSMGGILITTYLAGLAEMPAPDGQSFVSVGYDGPAARGARRSAAVAGVITVSSPLSGIASTSEGKEYGLPRGRDVHITAQTILACDDFTCGESGFTATRLTDPGWLTTPVKVKLVQEVLAITLNKPGSIINKLYDTWRVATMPDLHYDVLVSAWYAPSTPDWTDEDWGDGLIAVTGMQVLPGHFVGTDAQGQPYNFIRTAGRALTPTEKQRAAIPANIDYTFMLTPSLSGGYYGYPHSGVFNTYAKAWWLLSWTANPNTPAVAFPKDGELDYSGKFAHSLKPVLDRAYADAASQAPIFTTLEPLDLVLTGSVQEITGDSRSTQPLANAPVLILFRHNGIYQGMLQTIADADGAFRVDLGMQLDDYGVTARDGLEVQLRIGNDTTHDAATVVLSPEQLDVITNVGPVVLPRR